MADEAIVQPSPSTFPHAEELVRASAKRTRELFGADFGSFTALDHTPNPVFPLSTSTTSPHDRATQMAVSVRMRDYENVRELPPALAAKQAAAAATAAERRKKAKTAAAAESRPSDPKIAKMIEGVAEKADEAKAEASMALTLRAGGKGAAPNAKGPTAMRDTPSSSLVRRDNLRQDKPEWHPPWKIMRVISGHMGWVRS